MSAKPAITCAKLSSAFTPGQVFVLHNMFLEEKQADADVKKKKQLS